MPLKVEKTGKQTNQSLVQTFIQKVKRSGILIEARKRMFYQRPKSWQMKKRSALRREQKRKEFEKLRKLGKI